MKKAYKSKTILFFVVMILATLGTGVTQGGDFGAEFQNINWQAIIASIGGILMRFLSTTKVEL